VVCNMVIFYVEELLAPHPTPKLEGNPLSAVCDCLFNVFAATLHIWRPFLHLQPKDAPCHGDRDPLIILQSEIVSKEIMYCCQTFGVQTKLGIHGFGFENMVIFIVLPSILFLKVYFHIISYCLSMF
jgi:hypothetical protein